MSADVLLSAAAVVAWVWLIRVARVEWPSLKRMNDALGISTPRYVLRMAAARSALTPAGVVAAAVAAADPDIRPAISAGALAVAAIAMWCANEKTRRVLLRSPGPRSGGWDDPGPGAATAGPRSPGPRPPALGQAAVLRAGTAEAE